jgi:hypothetical protein
LGAKNGNIEAKSHPWFDNIDWKALDNSEIVAPYIPDKNEENFSQKHVNNQIWKDVEAVEENEALLKKDMLI